jgi:hypothetical protein
MAAPVFLALPVMLRDFLADPFRKYLVLFLILFGCIFSLIEQQQQERQGEAGEKHIAFFYHPNCPHCREQKKFIPFLKAKYPEIAWLEYDASLPQNFQKMRRYVENSGQGTLRIGVPMTFVGPFVIAGFETAETTGMVLESAIQAYLYNKPSLFKEDMTDRQGSEIVALPLWGEIKVTDYSLLALAVIIGLVDGFNPCAMWVLLYLISLIMTLNDRRKIWLLVGTFVAASGALYFLFMTAWLNAFLLLGYLRFLTLAIGLGAIGVGILNIREYLATRGQLVCKIGSAETRKKTMGRIERIVQAPLTYFSVGSIIVLAFLINSIEFACSAALPAIFSHTIALRDLPPLHYYGYILVYDFFFMLDDLIIFSLAVLALDTDIGHSYAKQCKIIGGVVLFVLGTLMVFTPDILR